MCRLVGEGFHSKARSRLVDQPAAAIVSGPLEPVQQVAVGVDAGSGRQVEEQIRVTRCSNRDQDRLREGHRLRPGPRTR